MLCGMICTGAVHWWQVVGRADKRISRVVYVVYRRVPFESKKQHGGS